MVGITEEIYLWNPKNGDVIKKLAGMGGSVWSVGYARDSRSIAFGNESNYQGTNERGPLQQVITLSQGNNYQISLGGEVGEESDYIRAIERHGDYELKPRQGGAYGYQAILQILKAGKVLHEIIRDSTSGSRHLSYSFTHDGRYLVSGGSNGALTFYDTKTGQKVRQFIGHTSDCLVTILCRSKPKPSLKLCPFSDVEVHLNGIQIAGGTQGKSRGEPMRRQVELEVTLEPGIDTLTFIAKHDKASSAPLFLPRHV